LRTAVLTDACARSPRNIVTFTRLLMCRARGRQGCNQVRPGSRRRASIP
jgi:hypothetical protein